jgi:hypothetical protein
MKPSLPDALTLTTDRRIAATSRASAIYTGGSSAHQWGLQAGSWAEVEAVVPLPTMWGSRPN